MKKKSLIVLLLPAFFLFVLQGWSAVKTSEGLIRVPGGNVWYRIVGSGKAIPLLTIHGGPGMPSDYLAPLAKLSDERAVIFYDQLGCGKSDKPKDSSLWRMERFVRELANLREALHLNQVHILGHSWGTILLNEYMSTNPGGVRSLIMSGPAINVQRWLADANRYRQALPEETQKILKKHEDEGTTDSREYQDAVMVYYQKHLCRLNPWPPEMQSTMDHLGMEVYMTMWGPSEFYATGNLKDYDGVSLLKTVRVPLLFMSGTYDEASPETARYYNSLVPGSSLVILQDCSHMAMLEEPERYVQAVRDFLHRVEARM